MDISNAEEGYLNRKALFEAEVAEIARKHGVSATDCVIAWLLLRCGALDELKRWHEIDEFTGVSEHIPRKDP